MKTKVQICSGFCKEESRGGYKRSAGLKKAAWLGRINELALEPFPTGSELSVETPPRGSERQGKNSAETITILYPKPSFVKAN